MTAPTRPVLRYHGGKWRLAPWIISFFPPHRTYVEPYGGAASVLLRKPRSYAEIYNELSPVVVNVFRVLRDETMAGQLREQLQLTPYSRVEFEAAYTDCPDQPIEWARRAIFRSFAGFGSPSVHDLPPQGTRTSSKLWRPPTGFRPKSDRSGTTPAHDWWHYPDMVRAFTARLRGVVIEQRPSQQVMATHDGAETLIYADPPYPLHTRSRLRRSSGVYAHEMTDDEHRALASALRSLEGMVVLSGYPTPLYDEELYPDWERHEREHLADGARTRTEVVWLNPACSRALREANPQHSLLESDGPRLDRAVGQA